MVIRSNPLKLMEIIKVMAIADNFDGNADATAGAAILKTVKINNKIL